MGVLTVTGTEDNNILNYNLKPQTWLPTSEIIREPGFGIR